MIDRGSKFVEAACKKEIIEWQYTEKGRLVIAENKRRQEEEQKRIAEEEKQKELEKRRIEQEKREEISNKQNEIENLHKEIMTLYVVEDIIRTKAAGYPVSKTKKEKIYKSYLDYYNQNHYSKDIETLVYLLSVQRKVKSIVDLKTKELEKQIKNVTDLNKQIELIQAW